MTNPTHPTSSDNRPADDLTERQGRLKENRPVPTTSEEVEVQRTENRQALSQAIDELVQHVCRGNFSESAAYDGLVDQCIDHDWRRKFVILLGFVHDSDLLVQLDNQ